MIEKYSRAVRILHWVHSGAFVILFLTGMIFYIPGLASLAVHGWIHTLHRIGAGVFVVIPIIASFTQKQR